MTAAERYMTGFICLLLLGCMALGAALIWQNSTRPAFTVESCVEVQVKRGGP